MRSARRLLIALPVLFALALSASAQAAPTPMRPTFEPDVRATQLRLEQRHDSLDRIADSLEVAYLSAVRLDSINGAAAFRAHRDSLVAMHLVPQPRNYTPPLAAITAESLVGFSAAGLLWANDRFQFDVDRGGYKDTWQSIDKVAHAGLAFAITDGCNALGGRAFICAGIVSLGGLAYEGTQGSFKPRDAWANAAGALLSASVNTWLRR